MKNSLMLKLKKVEEENNVQKNKNKMKLQRMHIYAQLVYGLGSLPLLTW